VDAPWSDGTLSINSAEPNAFQPQDIETLAMLAGVLSEAFVRVQDLRKLADRKQALEWEARVREAEHAIRLKIAEIDDPEDLTNVQLEISHQMTRLGTVHETCTLQIFNEDHTDFISCGVDRNGHPRWGTHDQKPLRSRLWSKFTNSMEDYPWVYEVWKSGQSHYQSCTEDDGVLAPGRSVIDVAFSCPSPNPHASRRGG
jgi:hypothetical protein